MRSYYSIFNCVNMFDDQEGVRRGLRRRKSVTRFFIISGTIKLYLDEDVITLGAGEEFTVSSWRWHGYEVVHHAKVLQMIDDGYEKFYEESKPW